MSAPFDLPALGGAGARFQTRENLVSEVRRVVTDEQAARAAGDAQLQTMIASLAAGRRIVGEWDASSGAFPTQRPDTSALQPGDTFIVSTGGTVDGEAFAPIEQLVSLGTGGATYAGNWLRWPDDGFGSAAVTPTGSAAAWPLAGLLSVRLPASATTAQIQAQIDALHAAGGGVVHLAAGTFTTTPSALAETYDNSGSAVAASLCGIVIRKNVYLVGAGREKTILIGPATINHVVMVAPENCGVIGMTISNDWNPGDAGATSGIFTLATASGADTTSKNSIITDVRVTKVAGYGIGLQNGYPTGWVLRDIEIDSIGADGIDVKARDASGFEPVANYGENITVRNHGLRIGGMGIDFRGVWHWRGVSVTEFPGVAGQSYGGVRFRTLETAPRWIEAAERSTLTGFHIDPGATRNGADYRGVEIGSPRISVSQGSIRRCVDGVFMTGNAEGNPNYCAITSVTSRNNTNFGVRIGAGIVGTRLVACSTAGNTTAGIRNEGTGTIYVGCTAQDTTPVSASTTGTTTQVQIGGLLDAEYGITTTGATGNLTLQTQGASADIDMTLNPKGGGSVRILRGLVLPSYTGTALGDAANAVNTSGKVVGRIVRNSTSGRILQAMGTAPTSPWADMDAVTVITPV